MGVILPDWSFRSMRDSNLTALVACLYFRDQHAGGDRGSPDPHSGAYAAQQTASRTKNVNRYIAFAPTWTGQTSGNDHQRLVFVIRWDHIFKGHSSTETDKSICSLLPVTKLFLLMPNLTNPIRMSQYRESQIRAREMPFIWYFYFYAFIFA